MDAILVWRLDRAFRSVVHFVNTVEDLRRWGVAFRSYSEAMVDTSGNRPMANLVMTVLAAVAEFERSLIAERVRAGMDRARKQGRHVGRPWALNGDLDVLRPAIEAGTLSRRQAAKRLGVTVSTISRALSRKGSPSEPPGGRVNADVSSAQ